MSYFTPDVNVYAVALSATNNHEFTARLQFDSDELYNVRFSFDAERLDVVGAETIMRGHSRPLEDDFMLGHLALWVDRIEGQILGEYRAAKVRLQVAA